MNFSYILNYSDCIGLFLVLIMLTYFNKYLNFTGKKWVFVYFGIFFIGFSSANILEYLRVPNCWIYDLIPLLLSVPLYYFFRSLPHSILFFRINLSSLIVFLILYLVSWEKVFDIPLNSEYYLYFVFFIFIQSAGYLLEELKTMTGIPIFARTEFWFIISLLFYSSVCALLWANFIYLFSNTISIKHEYEIAYLWLIYHNTILFISCMIFLIAISFRRTQPSLR